MLTADAFGVLPPIARLTSEQVMYHFLSGYTAKVAGDAQKGISEPQATFSTCFGAPFMALSPTVYANLLGERVARHKVDVWLVNTGWTGGPYGTGHRMEHRPHQDDAPGRALREAGRRRDADGPGLRIARAGELPGRAARGPGPDGRRGRTARRMTGRRGSWPGCSRRTSPSTTIR